MNHAEHIIKYNYKFSGLKDTSSALEINNSEIEI